MFWSQKTENRKQVLMHSKSFSFRFYYWGKWTPCMTTHLTMTSLQKHQSVDITVEWDAQIICDPALLWASRAAKRQTSSCPTQAQSHLCSRPTLPTPTSCTVHPPRPQVPPRTHSIVLQSETSTVYARVAKSCHQMWVCVCVYTCARVCNCAWQHFFFLQGFSKKLLEMAFT